MTRFVTIDDVTVVEHFAIPLRSGIELSARRWQPTDPTSVPAVLEYVPYRKRGGLETRDGIMHRYVAAHGYVGVRVDIRGSGESEGLLVGEYLQTELDDGAEVIDWISRQPWCNGTVGMIGKSWGGFNGLQIAALQPPALQAVITVCSTDDRYADDIHHKGGTLLTENLGWGSTMFSYNSMPPDPALVGDRWRKMWMERLEADRPWIIEWLRHQVRDDFYRHGSVIEDYSAIRVPVLAVGGWADSYTNAVFRLVNGLEAPVRAVVGPWIHVYPHQGSPGPDIDFLGMMVRWWDHWSKGIDRRVLDEPRLRVFVSHSTPPATDRPVTVGHWVGLDAWPPVRLTETISLDDPLRISTPQSVGAGAGEFCPMWQGPDLPDDQAADDGGSVCLDGPVLGADTEVMGAPLLELDFRADAPGANLVARLCEVFPDGRSDRVSYMPFNLTHHAGDSVTDDLVAGRRYHASVALDDLAHRFGAGNRIRLALSTAYWPLVWPQPHRASVTVENLRLLLPIVERDLADRGSDLGEGVGACPDPTVLLRPESHLRMSRAEDGEAVFEIFDDFGAEKFASGVVRDTTAHEVYRIRDDDPLSARMETRWTDGMSRDGWSIRTETTTTMTGDETAFRIEAELVAYEGTDEVFRRVWDENITRQGT